MGDGGKTMVRLDNRKHSIEVLNNKKGMMSADSYVSGLIIVRICTSLKTFFGYNYKIAFHCCKLGSRKLLNSTSECASKVFNKVQDNGDKKEIKYLKQLK